MPRHYVRYRADAGSRIGIEWTYALALAFDDICTAMNLPQTASEAREIVAARVIDLAREGVLDPRLLRERVLQEARALRVTL